MKLLGILVIMGLICIGLTSCDNYQTTNNEVLPSLKVQKNGDSEPTVSYDPKATINVDVIDAEYDIAKDIIKVLDTGDGEKIKDGQNVSISYIYYVMPGFDKQNSSWDDGGEPLIIQAYQNDNNSTEITQVLVGLKVGAVIAIAQPGFDTESQGLDTTGKNYSLQIIVVTATRDVISAANGAVVPQAELDPSLPQVTLSDTGEPSLSIPVDFTEPTDVKAQQLKRGSGSKIDSSKIVSFAYSAWRTNGTKIQSTWDSGAPLTTSLSNVNQAWKQTLDGATVGSQYLIIVPAELVSQTETPETQIFVVDVLDVIG